MMGNLSLKKKKKFGASAAKVSAFKSTPIKGASSGISPKSRLKSTGIKPKGE
jgi:hypothetical protein